MRFFIAAFACFISCKTALAQIQVDRFYPPVVSVGQETLIQAEGKFPKWPVQFVCDRDDVQIEAADESGKLKVKLSPSSAPGVTWIRLYDEVSASKLVPLLIESIAAVPEVEPNNKIADATSIDATSIIYGRLEKNGDIDTYRMSVKQGDTLVISAIANRYLRSPMDMVLQLVDARGNVLAQVDDVCGIDPQLVHQVDDDVELFGRVFAFPETPDSTISYAGASSFVYELRVTNGPFVDHVLPLVAIPIQQIETLPIGWNLPLKFVPVTQSSTTIAPALFGLRDAVGWQHQVDSPANAIGIVEPNDTTVLQADSFPFVYSGHILEPGETDRVRFQCTKATKYRATVHSRDFGFLLDSVLTVTSLSDLKEIARNDDRERNVADAAIEFTASDDGLYELSISDLVDGYGPRHAYSVIVEKSEPEIELVVANDRFTVKAGESLDIPVSIQRKYGFDKKLRVFADDLPGGVKAEPVVSEPKGDTSKSVTLKLTADKGIMFSGNVRIVAQPLNVDEQAVGSTVTAVHQIDSLIETPDLWLTVTTSQ